MGHVKNNFDWRQFFLSHKSTARALSGYYNENYVLNSPFGPVVIRKTITGFDEMDLRIVHEAELLKTLSDMFRIPEVIWVSDDGAFQVHSFIPGTTINDRWPRGVDIPAHFLIDTKNLIKGLQKINIDKISHCFHPWEIPTSTQDFFLSLIQKTESVYIRYRDELPGVYEAVGLISNPLEMIKEQSKQLTQRPMVLTHCDIHRKNCIVNYGTTWFLDWELALIGDPVYEIAVHVHKMEYSQEQYRMFMELVRSSLDKQYLIDFEDLELYRLHEKVKSVIVDTIRYYKEIIGMRLSEEYKMHLADKLHCKLQTVAGILSTPAISAQKILDRFTTI